MNTFTQTDRKSHGNKSGNGYSRTGGTARVALRQENDPLESQREMLGSSPRVQSQIQLQQMFDDSSRVATQAKLAEVMNSRDDSLQWQPPAQRRESPGGEETLERQTSLEEETAQLRAAAEGYGVGPEAPESIQRKENNTGLPDNLKAGVENLSGLSMDDVNVHYNSSQPATVQALAYTKGTDIHVGPGQEKHLAHEAWHVAQQKQGRVKPTLQLRGTAINDDKGLEREADVMGAKAMTVGNSASPLIEKPSSRGGPAGQLKRGPGQVRGDALRSQSAFGPGPGVVQAKWRYNEGDNLYEQDVPIHDYFWQTKYEHGEELYRTLGYTPWQAADAFDEQPPAAELELGAIEGDGWDYNENEGWYEQTENDGEEIRWRAKVVGNSILYQRGEFSDWGSAEDFTGQGLNPPQGTIFEEQRRTEALEQSGALKYAFEESELTDETPAPVQKMQRMLLEGLERIERGRKEDKKLLDTIITEEFRSIDTKVNDVAGRIRAGNTTPADHELLAEFFEPDTVLQMRGRNQISGDEMEEFKAGLRYKRVYEHEQNLLTINRRAQTELDDLIETELDGEDGVTLDNPYVRMDEGWKEPITATFEGEQYDLGTFYFEEARFERVGKVRGTGRPASSVYQHRTSGKQYVRDRYGRFVPRYVKRAVRYEDVTAILSGRPMPTKMEYDEPISGKEALDYGPGFEGDQQISHKQKVIGQIRGYSRFLSTTSSGRQATSTSRGTYQSPFGAVSIDLSRMRSADITEAHSEKAMSEIFGIEDLGSVEFIPKHVAGESASAKAGRDAYRAREVVIGSAPPEAVRAVPSEQQVKGLMILGLTGSATEANMRTVSGGYADHITFIEVNTRYKRTEDGHEGRSAFIFYDAGEVDDFDEVIKTVKDNIEGDTPGINQDAYVKEVPTGSDIETGKMTRAARSRKEVTKLLATVTSLLTPTVEALQSMGGLLKGNKLKYYKDVLQRNTNRLRALKQKDPASETVDGLRSIYAPALLSIYSEVTGLTDNLKGQAAKHPGVKRLRDIMEEVRGTNL